MAQPQMMQASDKQLRAIRSAIEDAVGPGARLSYQGVFRRPDGSAIRWLQVLLAVGPDDDENVRPRVHEAIEALFKALASLRLWDVADFLDISARRYDPVRGKSEEPALYIRCSWDRAAIKRLAQDNTISQWHKLARAYHNHWDEKDPLNKGQADL